MVPASWVDVIFDKADRFADLPAYYFLPEGEINKSAATASFAEIAEQSMAIGASLSELGVKGKPVVIAYPTGLSFLFAFYGTMLAGGIPVPIKLSSMGNPREWIDHQKHLIAQLGLEFILAPEKFHGYITEDNASANISWIDVDTIDAHLSQQWKHPGSQSHDIAFLQFTSGSTLEPKGVKITHGNLIANCEAIRLAGFYTDMCTQVTWLPHYHDMGLVGTLLAGMYGSVRTVMMSPQSFIKRPVRWLEAIHQFRAYASGGPAFGYAMAVQHISETESEHLDLSGWKVAFCGAEPIQPDILNLFSQTYRSNGFSENAFLPCYGMAESTLFVTGRAGLRTANNPDSEIRSKDAFGNTVLSVGKPFDNTDVQLVDPVSGQMAEEESVGEIWVRSPSVSPGYYHEAKDPSPFNATLNGQENYFRTGDLGFMSKGELFICGREKEVIIVRGNNLYPQDIEHAVSRASTRIPLNGVAAFSTHSIVKTEVEQFSVVVGIRGCAGDAEEIKDLAWQLQESIIKNFEVAPAQLVIVRAGEIPRTTSGKIKRNLCRNMLASGKFNILETVGGKSDRNDTNLYPRLQEHLARLDKRNTKYQFDMEQDIRWNYVNQPGRYFSDDFLFQTRINVELLKTDPELLEYYEWALALMTCGRFSSLENTVIAWGNILLNNEANTRSLELLVHEEQKHVDMFDRYEELLTAMKPEEAEVAKQVHQLRIGDFYSTSLELGIFESAKHQHYDFWLGTLFFEEYTLWMDEVLKDLGDSIQPAWKDLHHCHRQEESQHVITDVAYVHALSTTEEQRRRWSEDFLIRYLETNSKEYGALTRIIENRFPQYTGKLLVTAYSQTSDFISGLFSHRLLKRTRSIAPFAQNLAELSCAGDISVESLPTKSIFTAWLHKQLGQILNCPQDRITDNMSFLNMGLDSLGYIVLLGEIEKHHHVSLSLDDVLQHSTIRSLGDYLYEQRE